MSEPHSARCCAERTRQFLCWNCGRVKTQILVVLHVQCRQLKQPANISPNTARERVTPLMSGELGALIWGPDLSCFWVCLMLFRPTALQGSETDPAGPYGVTVMFLQSDRATRNVYKALENWPWPWFWCNRDPLCIISRLHFSRSSGFCFGCWFGTWTAGAIFRNHRIQPCWMISHVFNWVW